MKYLVMILAMCCTNITKGNIDSLTVDSLFVDEATQYVFSFSGLNLRSEATTDSYIVSKLTHGTVVKVQSISMLEEEIDNRIGRWVFVEVDGYEGYLFDGFLSSHEPPHLDNLEYDCRDREYCLTWIEDRLKTNVVVEENYEVVNPQDHPESCREVTNTSFESGAELKRVVKDANQIVSITSNDLSFNDVINYMDYYAACRTKWCSEWSGFKPTIIVPLKNEHGELKKLSVRFPYLVTAEKQGDGMFLSMNLSL